MEKYSDLKELNNMDPTTEYEKLVLRNKQLLKQEKTLKKQNELLSSQLKWKKASTSFFSRENQLTIGQKKIYSAHVETMRAVFERNSTGGILDVASVPNVWISLGEFLGESQSSTLVKELTMLFPEKKINFHQFLNHFVTKRTQKKGAKNFQLLNMNLSKKGKFKLKKVKGKNVGKPETIAWRYRYYYRGSDYETKQISIWHDLPLFALGEDAFILNFVCTMPKWTRAKIKISLSEKYNPLRQDVKFGKLRYQSHGDMMFNYGKLPQTWEDPSYEWPQTKKKGDNYPLDVIELGTEQFEVGEIIPVKVLGVLGLIDRGETDWKIIAITLRAPCASKMHDIDDVEKNLPGAINAIREYFRIYKVCKGYEPNSFAHGEMPLGKKYALEVIGKCHEQWKTLKASEMHVLPSPMPTPIQQKDFFS